MPSEGSSSPSLPAPRRRGFAAVRGIATDVTWRTRVTAKATGWASAFSEVCFKVDGLTVVSGSVGQVMRVENGHEILIAGQVRGTRIWPQAWWNRSTGSGYEPSAWSYRASFILGGLMLLAGLGRAGTRSYSARGVALLSVFPLMFLAHGAYTAYTRRRAIEAIRAMKTQKGLKRGRGKAET